jgi:hypothetical protein
MACVVLLSACQRCVSSSSADARSGKLQNSVDLRTAVLYTYPEYRETALLEATASVTRVIEGLTEPALKRSLQALRYQAAADGGWQLNSFHLTQVAPDTLTVSISYDVDQLAHLYVAPNGLSSTELGLYLPRDLPVRSERFSFEVRYASSPERCRHLVEQAVALMLANGQFTLESSTLDAGPVEDDVVRLRGVDSATVTFERTQGQVRASYRLGW